MHPPKGMVFPSQKGFCICPEKGMLPVADQREARLCCSCSVFSLHLAEQLAFGLLHGQRGFGIGLRIGQLLQLR